MPLKDLAVEEFLASLERIEVGARHPTARRYSEMFPNDPLPLMYWRRPLEELDPLMEQAMRDGRPLTGSDLLEAQGMEPPPPGAEV